MTQNNPNKDGRRERANICEVVAPKPNPPGTYDTLEQDNTSTLQNAAKAAETINNLKNK